MKPSKRTRKYELEVRKIKRKFNNRKKNLLKKKSEEQKEYYDYDGLIKLYHEEMCNELKQIQQKQAIDEIEEKIRFTQLCGLPWIMKNQIKRQCELMQSMKNKQEEFQKEKHKRMVRMELQRRLSRDRRLELEENAKQNALRNAALQRAEERAKTAELMTLLEDICGHPAEEIIQPVNECCVEDILLARTEIDTTDKVNSLCTV